MLARVVLAVLGLLVAPAAAVGDEVLATVPGAERISAYGGWVVFSVRQGESSTLHTWHDGVITPLGVRPNAQGFDHDVGPDAAGRPTVVYSRCLNRPRGCDLFAVTLDERIERRLTVSRTDRSEFAPAIWGDMLVFGHRKAGQRRADIVLAQLGKPWRRLPAGLLPGPCRDHDLCDGRPRHGYPTASDLGPVAVAYNWWLLGGEIFLNEGSELRVAPLDGGPARRAAAGWNDGTCPVSTFSPNVFGLGVRYGIGDCAGTAYLRFELSGLRRFVAAGGAPPLQSLAWDGDVVYAVRQDGTITRSSAPAWEPVKSGEVKPPIE